MLGVAVLYRLRVHQFHLPYLMTRGPTEALPSAYFRMVHKVFRLDLPASWSHNPNLGANQHLETAQAACSSVHGAATGSLISFQTSDRAKTGSAASAVPHLPCCISVSQPILTSASSAQMEVQQPN